MSSIEAVLLGLLQGLTEFLPVSSSGHLVILQSILGVQHPGVTLEITVHLGTFFSVLWVFWKDVYGILKGVINDRRQRKFLLLLFVGSIPAAAAGFWGASLIKAAFEKTYLVGLMLLATGSINYFIYIIGREEKGKNIASMNYLDALITGVFQGAAVLPGISRSGSTILGALSRGLKRETALSYSFLLALPAVGGAALFELWHWPEIAGNRGNILPLLLAAAAAFLSGIMAIKIFIIYLRYGKFYYFAYYSWLAGILTIIYSFFISF